MVTDSRRQGMRLEAEDFIEECEKFFLTIGDCAGMANCYYRRGSLAMTIFKKKLNN